MKLIYLALTDDTINIGDGVQLEATGRKAHNEFTPEDGDKTLEHYFINKTNS
jgi:hypothetical protein